MIGVNVGCGQHPMAGWENVDNSPTLLLAKLPIKWALGEGQQKMWQVARDHNIKRGTATKLPFPDSSVDSIYSSHMVEHLRPKDTRAFLHECRRILKPQGWVRVSVPNLSVLVADYLVDGDADRLVNRLMLNRGRRGHQWMYDERSLPRLFIECGFPDPLVVAAGETNLVFREGLDTSERSHESVYVEASRS
jgi:predicted SAM-dependent methyltransferase